MPFELPPWLTESAHPFESFAKGASVGVALGQAFSQNMYRSQALYVQARQYQQTQELRFRQLAQHDADSSLRSEVARTKMAHDTEDYNTIKTFVPTVSSAHTFDELNAINLPALHDTQNYLKMSQMLDRTKTEKALGEMGAELATTQNWADPAVYGTMLRWAKKAPDITLTTAYDHLLGRHQAAVVASRTANRLQSEIDRKSEMSANVGWVYPEDGSPPYLVDARGGTKFAPFHAGIEAGFTPEKTTIGGVDLIHVSPNKWQVVNRPITPGRMTDLEKANLNDIRKRRQAIVDSLPDDAPKLGMFGANKSAVAKYEKETSQIQELTTKESELIQKIEGRDSAAPDGKVEREGVKTEDRTTNAPPAVVAPTASFDAEVKMANEAIAANPDRKAAIAEQFKKRTGRDLP